MPAVTQSLTPKQTSLAKSIAMGRLGLATAFCLTPGIALRVWPGRGAHRDPVTRLLARSVGARDLALGLGTLFAIQKEGPTRGWLEAGVLADLGDAVAIVLAYRHLPRRRAAMALLSAAGAAAAGQWLVRSFPKPAGVTGMSSLVDA